MTHSPYYANDASRAAACYTGCIGRGQCPRCGGINYRLMGYYGAIARWAKAWGVSEAQAEERIIAHQHGALLPGHHARLKHRESDGGKGGVTARILGGVYGEDLARQYEEFIAEEESDRSYPHW